MPRKKKICDCSCCYGVCFEYVCAATIEDHYRKYGKFSVESREKDSSTSDDSGSDREVPDSDVYFEREVQLNSPLPLLEDSSLNDANQNADSPMEHTTTYSQVDFQHEDIASDDITSEESDCTDDMDTDDEEKLSKPVDKSQWSFSYPKDIYLSGIAKKPLSNCSPYTLLQALALIFSVFVNHPSMSKSAFTDYLHLQRELHQTVHLPTTYREARKMISPYLTPKIVFDVCRNDCIVYRDSEAGCTSCPKCGEPRYQTLNTKHLVSVKRFIYIPVGPRLARYFGEENLAKLVHEHSSFLEEDVATDDVMWDLHQSPEWKQLMTSDLGDGGMAMALELDGVHPFHNIGVLYSMTPMMITILNLPRRVRNLFQHILLVGIIPGTGRSEASNIDPYVSVLVDELLHVTGSRVVDEYLQAPVQVKLKLLLYILDYPGMSKLFCQLGSGSIHGCHWCWVKGHRCTHLSKVVYLGNRSYLEESDPLRNDCHSFPDKSVDHSTKPMLRTAEQENSHRQAYDKAKNKSQAKSISQATGSKGHYALKRLGDHNRVHNTLPDAM